MKCGVRAECTSSCSGHLHVTVCPVHRVHLSGVCPACGKQNMGAISNTSVIGHCVFCGAWLGSPTPRVAVIPDERETWVSSQVGDLIGALSSNERGPDVKVVRNNLQTLVQALGDGYMMRFAKKLGAQKSTCSTWLTGKTLPSLDYWLRMAWVSGVGIDRLILSSIAPEDVLATSRDTGCMLPAILNMAKSALAQGSCCLVKGGGSSLAGVRLDKSRRSPYKRLGQCHSGGFPHGLSCLFSRARPTPATTNGGIHRAGTPFSRSAHRKKS